MSVNLSLAVFNVTFVRGMTVWWNVAPLNGKSKPDPMTTPRAGTARSCGEFGILRKRCWASNLWARGYWVASSGNVTDEIWMEYIKNQTAPEPDDNFSVT